MRYSVGMISRLGWAIAVLVMWTGCHGPPTSAGRLVVASDLDNLPFAGIDAAGQPLGRDVEMMELLASRSGYQLVWSRMPFDRLLPMATEGRVDVVCATLGITEERAQRVLFSAPYFTTQIVAVVRVGEAEPGSLAALAGKRVSGAAGTTSERAIRKCLPDARGVFENKENASVSYRLLTGEIDAAVMDGPAADKLVAGSSGRLRCLAEPLARERYALVFPKSRPEIAQRVGRALEDLRTSGALEDLDRRHGLRRE